MFERRLNVVPKILFIYAPRSARKPKLYTQASGQVLPRGGLGRGKQIYLDNDRSDASLVIRALSSEKAFQVFVASTAGHSSWATQYRLGWRAHGKSHDKNRSALTKLSVLAKSGLFARLSGPSRRRRMSPRLSAARNVTPPAFLPASSTHQGRSSLQSLSSLLRADERAA